MEIFITNNSCDTTSLVKRYHYNEKEEICQGFLLTKEKEKKKREKREKKKREKREKGYHKFIGKLLL